MGIRKSRNKKDFPGRTEQTYCRFDWFGKQGPQ